MDVQAVRIRRCLHFIQYKPGMVVRRITVMPIAWTDFSQCVNDRIAYYRQSYEQATRIYYKLLNQNSTSEDELANVLEFQQAMADEICRCRQLLIIYSTKRAPIFIKEIITMRPAQLN